MPLLDQVSSTIRRWNMFASGQRVLAAVSGGPDSVALLGVLNELAPRMGVELSVAHFDHQIRGPAARKGDAALVAALAGRFGLPLNTGSGDVPAHAAAHGLSLEHAARELRYTFLARTAAATGCHVIATGHTRDDHAETVLLALIRGAGAAGLGGIRPVTGKIVRPLVEASRDDVLRYLTLHGLDYRVDETNADQAYLRNRVRLSLLPMLESGFNPAIRATVARSGHLLQDEDSLLAGLAGEFHDRIAVRAEPGVLALGRAGLSTVHVALARRVLRLALGEVAAGAGTGDWADGEGLHWVPTVAHIENLLDLLRNGEAGASIDLPNGHWAELGYQALLIHRGPRPPDVPVPGGGGEQSWPLAVPGETDLAAPGWSVVARVRPRAEWAAGASFAWHRTAQGGALVFRVFLALDALSLPLSLRSRRPGDRLRPHGGPGERKVQDLLVDAKIPRRLRDRLPVLCDSTGQVCAVLPVRPAAAHAVTPNTERVLILDGSVAAWQALPALDQSPHTW